jgi:hypothetical protein
MHIPRLPRRAALTGTVAVGVAVTLTGFALAAPGNAATGSTHALRGAAARQVERNAALGSTSAQAVLSGTGDTGTLPPPTNDHSGDDGDLADSMAAYNSERTAPAGYMTGDAVGSAAAQAAALPASGGKWQEVTTQAYNAETAPYLDPFWSNVGAGFSLVGGRITALAQTPDGAWFAGAADGGVWRSTDRGGHWTPVTDNLPSMSTGALAVAPDGSLWLGTGEANESQDSYGGAGVFRSANDGKSWTPVGGASSPVAPRTIFRIAFDPAGDAYAATNNGLFRWDAAARTWSEVLDPAGATDFPPYDQQVTDVAVVPGSHGRDVIAAIGWHGPTNIAYNGFYESTDGGRTFSEVTLTGALAGVTTGRTTFAYSKDGSKLYALVEDATSAGSSLLGIYSVTGTAASPASVAGPWTQLADATSLGNDGSGMPSTGEAVGVQAWYNETLLVDPANADHVYAGLEEVFQTSDGGATWSTASPYWNYGFACDASNTCPNTTHPDQHALMIADGKVVSGNDGGVYSRPNSDTQQYGDWTDLNASLHDLQFYDARAGQLSDGSTTVVGGLQDNGTLMENNSDLSQAVEPASGDGFDVVVDPANASNWAGEYTYGAEYTTTDGGVSFNDYISPTCEGQAIVGLTPMAGCDPNPRFVAPFIQDQQNPDTWVTGGEYVWLSTNGYATTCTGATACDWKNVYDTGAGNSVTALDSVGNGKVIYAAWVANGGNPGATFASGIATNYGGTWHEVNTSSLPDRYIAGVTVDPANPAHAYAVFNGYSRRFIPGGGVGHVFETFNGGATWTDISGNLPDIASDALVTYHGALILATDDGVFTAAAGHGTRTQWERLGGNLPNVVVDSLHLGPDGYVYAGTHGRGIWRFKL